jgi:hypothetical protein
MDEELCVGYVQSVELFNGNGFTQDTTVTMYCC